MATASDRGWPLPPTTVRVPCDGIPLNLHPAVAPLFAELIRRVEAVKGKGWMTSSGGYNPRPVRGYELKYTQTNNARYLSNHAWGLAADFRAGSNPMQSTLRTDMPGNISQIAAECGLQWGGDYEGRKDPMHFEFVGTPAEAAAAVARLGQGDDDEEWLNVDVPNPYANGGKGGTEPAAVALGYLEQRIREGIKAELPALVAQAVLDAKITSAVDNKTVGTVRQFFQWIDRATNLLANKKG